MVEFDVVPETSALLALASGAAGLALFIRRRQPSNRSGRGLPRPMAPIPHRPLPCYNPPVNRQPPTIQNRRARHEYFVDETFEAGIVLVGTEVKSVRAGKANLTDSYCRVEDGELWLYHMHIAPYVHGNIWNVEPRRKRKLLMHKPEIRRLAAKYEQRGLALIPLQLYFKEGKVKIEIGVCRGKKLYDKREAIAERDAEMQRRQAEVQRERK